MFSWSVSENMLNWLYKLTLLNGFSFLVIFIYFIILGRAVD